MTSKLNYDVDYSEDHGDFIITVVKSDKDVEEVADFFFDIFLEGNK